MTTLFRHLIPIEIEEILESTGEYERLVDWFQEFTEEEREKAFNEGYDNYGDGYADGYDEAKRIVKDAL